LVSLVTTARGNSSSSFGKVTEELGKGLEFAPVAKEGVDTIDKQGKYQEHCWILLVPQKTMTAINHNCFVVVILELPIETNKGYVTPLPHCMSTTHGKA
jgi:hypothetical protein